MRASLRLCSLTFFVCGAMASWAMQRGGYELANNQVLMRLDANGRLTELTNRQTGHSYIATLGKAPWRIFYRLGTGYYRPGDAVDIEVAPDDQHASVRKEGSVLLIEYKSLIGQTAQRTETKELQVGLVLRVTLEGDQFTWTATIDNREPGIEVSEIWVPWLYGIGDLGLGPEADVLYWPEAAGRRIVNPRKVLAGTDRAASSLRMAYPWPASMQWFSLNNGHEGLYVGGHDKTLMTTCLNVMGHEGTSLSASIVKYPFVKAGETWTSEPSVVRLYRGGWHDAARFYRAWTRTWMPDPTPPEWIRRAPGWAHPALGRKSQSGHITGRYSDYPAMLRDARAIGLNTLIVFGWVKQGFDNRYPEYEPDEVMGGADELRKAVTEVERAGGRMILYTQGQLIDPTTDFYQTTGRGITAKTIWGYDYREQYAFFGSGTFLETMRNKHFGVACPSAPGWLQQLQSQFETVKGHNAQGIIFDQMGGRPPYICFDADHKHDRPSLANGPGKVANMRRLREVMKSRDPQFAFVIELVADCYTPWVDIIHAWGPGFFPAPDSYGALFRYTFPEAVITNRTGGPYDRKAQYGHAFTLGLRFDAATRDGQHPEVGPHLARLTELRNQHADLLLEGKFVDSEGFVCDNSRVTAHGFVAGNRLAVALWNPEETPQKAVVVAPGYKLKSALWQNPAWSGPDHTLMPGDVAVLIFSK